MHNRQALDLKLIWKACCDWHIWPLYFISLVFNLPTVPVSNYLQISFRRFGFSRPMANLLAVPNTIMSMINVVLITLLSEAVDNRSWVCMTQTVVRFSRLPNLSYPLAWLKYTSGSSPVLLLWWSCRTLPTGSTLVSRQHSYRTHGSTPFKFLGCRPSLVPSERERSRLRKFLFPTLSTGTSVLTSQFIQHVDPTVLDHRIKRLSS